jgi:hypothetical protein
VDLNIPIHDILSKDLTGISNQSSDQINSILDFLDDYVSEIMSAQMFRNCHTSSQDVSHIRRRHKGNRGTVGVKIEGKIK